MIKKALNQNAKYAREFIDAIEPNFVFSDNPINRLNIIDSNRQDLYQDKKISLSKLKEQINSIENCNFKVNSKNLIMGNGNINSSIMIIGEAPGDIEDDSGSSFQGESGVLLKKMLSAINLEIENVYTTYAINFKIPESKKPSTQEIKRYSVFLKEHISIINPKIVILMGGTAMESVTNLKGRISDERGKWKEIILKDQTLYCMITFSPSYLIRFPENKKYSWEDLKNIKKKIQNLNIKV